MVAKRVAKKVLKKPPEKVRIGQKDYFWRNKFYEAVYWVASSPLPEFFFVAALVFSARQPSAYFNYATQVWQPLLLLSAMSALAYLAYRILFGKGSTSHLAAMLFAYVFYCYYTTGTSTVHTLLPKLSSSPVRLNWAETILVVAAALGVAALVAVAARLLIAKLSFLKNLQAFKIMLFVVALVFVVELARFAGRYFAIH